MTLVFRCELCPPGRSKTELIRLSKDMTGLKSFKKIKEKLRRKSWCPDVAGDSKATVTHVFIDFVFANPVIVLLSCLDFKNSVRAEITKPGFLYILPNAPIYSFCSFSTHSCLPVPLAGVHPYFQQSPIIKRCPPVTLLNPSYIPMTFP